MNMIYNSPLYCVVEFSAAMDGVVELDDDVMRQGPFVGGYEIMDKLMRREIFIGGEAAQAFRDQVSALIEGEPTIEEIDDYLGGYAPLMHQPVIMH
jgi:hypothetical protein